MSHHGLQDLVDADTFLGRTQDGQIRVEAQFPVDLVFDHVHVRRGQVNFVDHRNDGQIVLHGQVEVGQGLGLHPLGGVHHQEHAFAGSQGPADLIGKIHVSRGVDKVQVVLLPILSLIRQGNGIAFDGYAAFTLDVHGVEDLIPELPFPHHTGVLDQAVGQSGLAVVNMGDDAEVADVGHIRIYYETEIYWERADGSGSGEPSSVKP